MSELQQLVRGKLVLVTIVNKGCNWPMDLQSFLNHLPSGASVVLAGPACSPLGWDLLQAEQQQRHAKNARKSWISVERDVVLAIVGAMQLLASNDTLAVVSGSPCWDEAVQKAFDLGDRQRGSLEPWCEENS
jgi:hypothetical protein